MLESVVRGTGKNIILSTFINRNITTSARHSNQVLISCVRGSLTHLFDVAQSLELWGIYDLDHQRVELNVAMDGVIEHLQLSSIHVM